jgi:hypothetical protein
MSVLPAVNSRQGPTLSWIIDFSVDDLHALSEGDKYWLQNHHPKGLAEFFDFHQEEYTDDDECNKNTSCCTDALRGNINNDEMGLKGYVLSKVFDMRMNS